MQVQAQESTAQSLSNAHKSLTGVSLDTFARRQDGTVVGLKPASNEREKEMVLRLMEIGFLPGEQVRVLATGFPGADPLAIRVGQATFALRKDEAAFVLVQPAKA